MPVIAVLGRLRQEDEEFEDTLYYIVRYYPEERGRKLVDFLQSSLLLVWCLGYVEREESECVGWGFLEG